MNNSIGLSKSEILGIIKRKLQKNADILIGIDDPELNMLLDILIESFADAIEANNEEIQIQLKEMLEEEDRYLKPGHLY